MVAQTGIPVPYSLSCAIRLRSRSGLAMALRSLWNSGLVGVLLDLDHLPRLMAVFLGRSTLPPGRPFHLAAVSVSGYLFFAGCTLFAGLLVTEAIKRTQL